MRDILQQSPLFEHIDVQFADLITKIAAENKEQSDILYLSAALVSHFLITGHTSLILDSTLWVWGSIQADVAELDITIPSQNEWLDALKKAPTVIGQPGEWKPLILDGNRLYMQRHYSYEISIVHTIHQKATHIHALSPTTISLIHTLFEDAPEKEAVTRTSIERKFSVISGGPGRGKTYTIARIMALILTENRSELLALAAPTGKAASRMGQSILQAVEGLSNHISDKIISIIKSVKQSSIHSLIGWDWYGGKPRYNSDNPLPYNTIIIDEASMIDADIAFSLLSALNKDARIILVGDKDQLASVEAGSVMASICAALTNETLHPAKEAINELTVSHRFSQESGIGQLAQAINDREDFTRIEALFSDPQYADELTWIDAPSANEMVTKAVATILDDLGPYFSSKTAKEAIENARKAVLLSPLRRTPFGINELNKKVEIAAAKRGLIDATDTFYHLRPILIRQNDHALSLFNGDVAITFNEADKKSVWVETTEKMKSFSPYYLPPHETMYAMTVHKSQGSEFDHVILLLPEQDIPLLTIELIYTALTRAKKRFTLIGSADVFRAAISRRIVRSNGLEQRLWNM